MKRVIWSLLAVLVCVTMLGAAVAEPAAVLRAPGQPQNLKVVAVTATEIDLEWDEVSGAESYEIQRAADPTFADAVTKTVTDPEFAATGLTLGTTYYFRVRAIKAGEPGAYSTVVSAYPAPEGPADLEAKVKTGSSIQLKWEEVEGISGYTLQRSTDGANFTVVARVLEGVTSYMDTGLAAGVTYTYRLYTFTTVGDETADSVEYAEAEISMIPPTPGSFTATAISGGFRLSWKAVKDISYYTVYRSVNNGDDGYPVLVTDLTANSYDDTKNIRIGSTYHYYIVAVKDGVPSAASKIIEAVGKPVAPSGLKAAFNQTDSTAIDVTWNPVEDVTGYILESCESSKDGPYTELKRGFFTSYKDTGLAVGTGRYYRVKTYVADVESDPSAPVYDAARPQAVKNLKLTNTSPTAIKIKWKASAGAAGYRIFRGTTPGRYSLIVTLPASKTAYTNKKLTTGTTYYYKVEPYILDPRDGKTVMAGVGVEDSLQALPLAPEVLSVKQNKRENAFLVKWEKVKGSTGYKVYYRVTGDTDYILGAEVASTQAKAVVPGLKPGTRYDIAVRSSFVQNGQTVLGGTGKMNGIKLKILAPVSLGRTTVNLTSMYFTWGAVAGVDGYEVTVTGKQDDYSLSTTVASNSVLVDGVTCGYDYECAVRAYSVVAGETLYSAWSNTITMTPTSPTPKDFKATASSTKYTVTMTWTPEPLADGYILQRSTKKDSGYEQITRLTDKNASSYTNTLTAAAVGQTYYYRICSYVDAMGVLNQSPFTTPAKVSLKPATTTLKLLNASPTSITLNWTKLDGVDGYNVYRSLKPDTDYTLVKRVGKNTTVKWKNKNLVMGTLYYYKVCAYRIVNGKTIQGEFSNVACLTAAPKTPAGLKVTPYAKSALVKWKKVSGATGYYVYRATGDKGEYQRVATVQGLSYEDTKLGTGVTYKYKVSAYQQNGKIIGESKLCKYVKTKTAVNKVTGVKSKPVTEAAVRLTWKAVKEAEHYQIQMATAKDGKYTLVATVEKTEAVIEKLPCAVNRYFRIRALVGNAGGAWSDVTVGYAAPKAPEKLEASAGSTVVTLSWKASVGATGYRVYRKAPGASKYTLIATLDGKDTTFYQDTGLKSGKTYSYKVTAIAEDSAGNVFVGLTTKPIEVKTK